MKLKFHVTAALCLLAVLAGCGADGVPNRPGQDAPAQSPVFDQDNLRRGVVIGN